jgi:hypothetical protein
MMVKSILGIVAISVALAAGPPQRAPISGPVEGNSFAIGRVRVFDGAQVIEQATVIVRNGLAACGESHFVDPIPRRVSAANRPIERKVDRERAMTLRTTASVLNDPIPRG